MASDDLKAKWIAVERVASPTEATTMIGDLVPPREANVKSPSIFTDAETGQVIAAYLPIEGVSRLRKLLHTIQYGGLQRSANYNSRSQTFGFQPRRPLRLRESCSTSKMTTDHPDMQRELDRIADQCARAMMKFAPEIVESDKETTKEVLPEWRLGEEKVWTSGVINHTAQLPYHRDSFNYPVWSAMPVLRRGARGGFLHIPEYDLVFACQDSYALYFMGKELVHGVTPITKKTPDGYRFSVVFYSLKGMKDCQPEGTPVRVPEFSPREDGGRGRQPSSFKEVPIETLKAGDKVVTWTKGTSSLATRGHEITRAGSRPYDGPLVTVDVAGKKSRYTPEHHTVMRFGPTLDDGKFIVYLMERNGQYRIGRTTWNTNRGLRLRAHQEKADQAWILSAHETATEASLAEAVVSATFGIPGVSFYEDSQYIFPLEEFWAQVGDNRAQAEACLSSFGRLIDRPLIRRPEEKGKSWIPSEGVAAANLMSGMLLPVPKEDSEYFEYKGWTRWGTSWEPAKVGTEHYTGQVYSLEVDKAHNYVADGIVTHNCYTHAVETQRGQERRSKREREMAKRLAEGDTSIPGSKKRPVATKTKAKAKPKVAAEPLEESDSSADLVDKLPEPTEE